MFRQLNGGQTKRRLPTLLGYEYFRDDFMEVHFLITLIHKLSSGVKSLTGDL
jgi:hypothetical protein